MVQYLLANTGDARETDLFPGSGRFPGVGNGKLLQYSLLENFMHRGAWRVMGLQKSQMQLMDHTSIWGPVHPKHSILAVFLHLEFPCPWMTNMVNGMILIELKGRQHFFFFSFTSV